MMIRRIAESHRAVYQKLVEACGCVFNSLDWLDMFDDEVQIYGLFNRNDELIGGFITYVERRFGLSIYRDPPFTPMIGPFLSMVATNPVVIMDSWKRALSAMVNFFEDMSVSILSVSLQRNIIDTQPFIWRKYKVVPKYTYLLDLTLPQEEIWRRMSNERRKNITKGLKDGLSVSKVDDLRCVKDLVLKTFSRQDEKLNHTYLDKILFTFAKEDNSFAFATYSGDTPIASSFCVHDRTKAYYLLGGYDCSRRHHGAGALSMWEAIKYAKNAGLKQFDFEGSMIPQIETYFRGFGGHLTAYYHVNKAKLPLEFALKLVKRELF